MRKVIVSLALLSAVVTCSVASAAERACPRVGGEEIGTRVYKVTGEVVGDDLMMTVEAGSVATKALRFYSEPSHTLQLLVIDSAFAQTLDGIGWMQTYAAQPVATVKTKLPGAARVQMRGRPVDDDRIVVWVYGDFPSGEQDNLVTDATVSPNFSFSNSVRGVLKPDAGGRLQVLSEYHHCCSSGGCDVCTDCSGVQFTCCLAGGCCSIQCGWVMCPYECP